MRVIAAVVAVALLVGGATVFADVAESGPEQSNRAIRVPLDEVRLACPESAYQKDVTGTQVSAVAAPASPEGTGADAARGGALTLTDLDAPAGEEPAAAQDKRGSLLQKGIREGKQPPLVTTGTGLLAPGVAAGQLTRTVSGPNRGLSESVCGAPGSEFWFVGGGARVGQDARLYLTNVDEAAAQLDIVLYDEKGRVEDDATRSVQVGPREQRIVELDRYAPTSKLLAVQVVTSRGRVVAALQDTRVDSEGRSLGVDWIPPTQAPRKRQVVPGIAGGEGPRVLTVVAPGDTTAVVDISVLGGNGTFQPAENGRMQVPAGSLRQIRMEAAVAGRASGLEVSADVPVVVGVRTELPGEAESRDFAHAAASGPLTGPAIVPMTRNEEDVRASLLVHSLDREPARAEVTLLRPDGKEAASFEVKIPGGGTVEKRLPRPKDADRYAVIVDPVQGKIGGARVQVESTGDGPMISSWPLFTSPTTTVRPVTTADLGVPFSGR